MKKINIMTYVLSMGMLSALISCDSDLAVSRQTGDNESTTFSAIMNSDLQSDTRTSLQGLSTIWSAGDEIKVNGTDITISQGEGTRYGLFRGNVSDHSGGYYAGYPASATTFSAETMTLAIPATQTYNASNPLLGQMPMAAYATADANGNVALNFKNAANILKLNLWGESGTNVKQIVISSSSAALSGTLTVNTSTAPISFGDITENKGTSITLTCTDAVTLSTDQNDPTPFYVILPKLSGNANLTVKIYNSNGQYQQSTITVDGEHNVQLKDNANRLFATAPYQFVPPKLAGALPGLFSVAADKQVQFSQGNLQYLGSGLDGNSSPIWRFAEHQWDYMGYGPNNSSASLRGNVNISGYTADGTGNKGYNNEETNTGAARDYFGWGTSNYDYRGTGDNYYFHPYSTANNASQYGPSSGNLSGNSDWGYNKISNGSDTENSGWRTLSCGFGMTGEWYYLLYTRATSVTISGVSNARYSKVKIEYETGKTINGLLIYPDEFAWTSDMGTAPASGNVNTNNANFPNNYTAGQFQKMEEAGVVFLPLTGYRWGTGPSEFSTAGVYWSSSSDGSTSAYDIYFNATVVEANGANRDKSSGLMVRLVKDHN